LQRRVYRSLEQAISEERLAGLFSGHVGQEARTLTPALEPRMLEWVVKRKPSNSTHWSARKIASIWPGDPPKAEQSILRRRRVL